jgi:hypothetical protein
MAYWPLRKSHRLVSRFAATKSLADFSSNFIGVDDEMLSVVAMLLPLWP